MNLPDRHGRVSARRMAAPGLDAEHAKGEISKGEISKPQLSKSEPTEDEPREDEPREAERSQLNSYGGAWRASLRWRVAQRQRRSILVDNQHQGPLRLQKALWPEGDQPIHLLLLHPPGGLAGGDQLGLEGEVEANAHVFVTTPGAGKFYRAATASHFQARLLIGEAAGLEWMPQETIVHTGTQASTSLEFQLRASSRLIGSEILVLGRKAHGEHFSAGYFRQSLSIRREDQLIFQDISLWRPDLLAAQVSMAGLHVSGLLWAAMPESWSEDEVAALEASLDACKVLCGVSQVVPGLLLIRALGSDVEMLRGALHQAWAVLRPRVFGLQAKPPRIWNT